MGDRLLKPREVGEILNINPRTVVAWLRSGKMNGHKMGRVWRVRRSELDRFLESNRV